MKMIIWRSGTGLEEVSIEIEEGHSIPIQPYDDFERNERIARICYDALNNFWSQFTKNEYEEYRRLKKQAARIEIFSSLNEVTRLEDDIDIPVKRCVAAFALLGCQPKWSCCGFDYKGQHLHKGHQYGRIYFILERSPVSEACCKAITASGLWQYAVRDNDTLDLRIDIENVISQWDEPSCIHYHEPFACYIQQLEDYLYRLSDLFAEEVVLGDNNGKMKEAFSHWQYPTMEDWIIRKEDYI